MLQRRGEYTDFTPIFLTLVYRPKVKFCKYAVTSKTGSIKTNFEYGFPLAGVYVTVVIIILILGNAGAVFRKFETLKTTVNIGE